MKFLLFLFLFLLLQDQDPLVGFSSVKFRVEDVTFGFVQGKFSVVIKKHKKNFSNFYPKLWMVLGRKYITLSDQILLYNDKSYPKHFLEENRSKINEKIIPENILQQFLHDKSVPINQYTLFFTYKINFSKVCNENKDYAIIILDDYASVDFKTRIESGIVALDYQVPISEIFHTHMFGTYTYWLKDTESGRFRIKGPMLENKDKGPTPLDFSRTNDYEFYFVDIDNEGQKKETKMEPLPQVELKNCRAL